MSAWRVLAPAKLTWSLRVGDRRPDGYHDLESEMVALSLADELVISEPGEGIELSSAEVDTAELELGDGNLIARALALAGRSAAVALAKRIPLGGGLGGGSADAGAILRWAGVEDPALAASLGGDVPFCVRGGRAMVRGLGELVEPLEHVDRRVTLLLPPVAVSTPQAYRALDDLRSQGRGRHERNDLTEAAEVVAPRLRSFREAFEAVTGAEVLLAGSGSTLFVEGGLGEHGCAGMASIEVEGATARLLEAWTVPAEAGDPKEL